MYGTWNDVELSPADTFRRNFWVCAIDDPSAFLQRDVIGIGNILVESDYPHADSTWPHTQQRLAAQLAGLDDREIAAGHLAERRPPVPSPGADRGAARSRCLLIRPPTRTVVADTPSGPVVGRRDARCLRFGGVPYARADRWRLPEPITWTEPFDATTPGRIAAADRRRARPRAGDDPRRAEPRRASPPRSARPALGRLARPVLVWVPGGSYRVGGAVAPALRRRAPRRARRRGRRAQLPARRARAGSRPAGVPSNLAAARSPRRGRLVARQRRRVRR